jgi:hypothetical protein
MFDLQVENRLIYFIDVMLSGAKHLYANPETLRSAQGDISQDSP